MSSKKKKMDLHEFWNDLVCNAYRISKKYWLVVNRVNSCLKTRMIFLPLESFPTVLTSELLILTSKLSSSEACLAYRLTAYAAATAGVLIAPSSVTISLKSEKIIKINRFYRG